MKSNIKIDSTIRGYSFNININRFILNNYKCVVSGYCTCGNNLVGNLVRTTYGNLLYVEGASPYEL